MPIDYKKYYKEKLKEYRKKVKDKYELGSGVIWRYGLFLSLKIYKKYNRKCFNCDSQDDLTIHHLDNKGRNYYEIGLKPNNNEDNLMLLCRKCHGSIHGRQHK